MGNLFLTLCSGALGVRGLGRKARPNYRNVQGARMCLYILLNLYMCSLKRRGNYEFLP